MGFLDRFKLQPQDAPPELPSGSFTIDRDGRIITTTIPTRFPRETLDQIAVVVLQTFSEARKAELSLTELNVKFGAINIRAVDMRGGAMVFLSPRGERSVRIKASQ